jgi:hypothetical protein
MRQSGVVDSQRGLEAAYSRGGYGGRRPGPRLANQPEFNMSDPHKAAQGSAATAKPKLTFKQMSPRQKFVFILKLTVSIISFGMIFPNLMND